MATKKAPSSPVSPQNGVQFINHTFDDKTKAAFKKSLENLDAERFFERIDTLIEGGYSISIKHDDHNNCISAFIIAKNGAGQNSGCILTGRGRTSVSALYAAIYRHFDVFDTIWPVETVNHRGTDDD